MRAGAAYYLRGKRHALIETGTSLSAPHIVRALPSVELDYIFVTHVHLDHAGGAGELAGRYPRATVIVHPRGAKHLIDPTRLVQSVRQATGEMFSL
ncbi:MAG TPA: MBL fold metallo-hydrolase, partial [Candidatus Acetothermia bacterium]|nr:MBL fold metallo-hydrolase [Candidatus Acetothermia bacterium]